MPGRFALVLAVGLVAGGPWAGVARALEVPPAKGHVSDYAGLLPPDRAAALDARLSAYQQRTGHEFGLLIVPSLEGEPIETFGIRVAEKWSPGGKKEDFGLILIVAVQDHKTRIEVGQGLEGSITDALSSRVAREVLKPAFQANDYAGGLDRAFEVLMHQASGSAEPAAEPVRKRAKPLLGPIVLPILFFLLLSFFGGGGRRGRRGRRGGVFGPGLGGFGAGFGAGGGFSGGGFGGGGGWSGGGGGGGFGGSGGGFSGGGASGDW